MNAPPIDTDAIARAAGVLRRGGLVAFPTETVYGLGADAGSAEAVARIFAAKGRPADHPLIVHLAATAQLDDWALDVPDAARVLAARFWPGPLTMILRRHPRVVREATGGQDTVGLRVPAHPVAQALLAAFAGAVAAPSANRFGAVSPTTAAHVRADLGAAVDLVLDGGACAVGLESTIVDLSSGEPTVLRPGAVSRAALAAALGRPVGGPHDIDRHGAALAAVVRAPGTLAAHYAPRARVLAVAADEVDAVLHRELAAGRTVAALCGRPTRPLPLAAHWIDLGERADEIAHRLYGALREADLRGVDVIVAALPEPGAGDAGLVEAIADRLRRAAAGGVPSS